MAAFSRLQLAAALLEYDNDPTNPDAPKHSAYESAIFTHARRNKRLSIHGRRPDHLGVSFPSDIQSSGGPESLLETGRRSSIDALRNPFGTSETADSLRGEEEGDVEVDLASWGLDSFIPKETGSRGARKKPKQGALPDAQPVASLRRRPDAKSDGDHRRSFVSRSVSLGGIDSRGPEGGEWTTQTLPIGAEARRRSIGSVLDTGNSDLQAQQRPTSAYALVQDLPDSSSAPSIPFPSFPPQPESQLAQDSDRNIGSALGHERGYSGYDLGPMEAPKEPENPFAVEPPSPQRASRFDPKMNHARTLSNGTMADMGLRSDDNAPRPASRSSKLQYPTRVRTISNESGGSGEHLDDDDDLSMIEQEPFVSDRPYSTLELLRPKVLVMPSPLQIQASPPSPPPPVANREGFQLTVDGTPLPPGARATRRISAAPALIEQLAVRPNSFTPNPRMSLSLSQLTFRNTLVTGGERDVAYADIDRAMPRASQEGEQMLLDSPIEETSTPEIGEVQSKNERMPGKLYGRSLIDDIESRKSKTRSKQRVFTGDERASMMLRTQTNRSSTLIDPTALRAKQHLSGQGSQQAIDRRTSVNVKPYITFGDDEDLLKPNTGPETRMNKSRSVFGVDTIWEHEMVKLREIEEEEKREAEAEEARRLKAEQEAERHKKKKAKGKGKEKAESNGADEILIAESVSQLTRISQEPPVLPTIQKATRRRPPSPVDDDESEGSDESQAEIPSHSVTGGRDTDVAGWHAGSSDEEESKPQHTTGVGPRYKKVPKIRPRDEDSEEDLPLFVAIQRAVHGTMQRKHSDDASDEERPLSLLLEKKKLSLTSSNDSASNTKTKDVDDDDLPLGLRASQFLSSAQVSHQNADAEDDDMPLAYHPEHQRRTQYQFLAAQQHQLLMQAQMHNSMFFATPPMIAPGFFPPPMAPPMMMPLPPVPIPSPPPLHDPAKFGLVDRWRRGVVAEKES